MHSKESNKDRDKKNLCIQQKVRMFGFFAFYVNVEALPRLFLEFTFCWSIFYDNYANNEKNTKVF